jgi:hypothetical protein
VLLAPVLRSAVSGPPGASRELGAGSWEPGARSRELGAGSPEPGAGSWEPGARSRELGAGAGSRSQEPGDAGGQPIAVGGALMKARWLFRELAIFVNGTH